MDTPAFHGFPDTGVSLVSALTSGEAGDRERAFATVARAYRAPVVALVQRRWGLEPPDAEDLTQEFFAEALAKGWLHRYDPGRARFRTFLRACLVAFAATQHEAAQRLKRGGGAPHVPIDDAHDVPGDDALDALFEREWRRSILTLALDRLRAECEAAGRTVAFDVFVAYDVAGAEGDGQPTYADVAAQFALPATQVTNFLHWARSRFRRQVLDALRELSASDEEYREDVRALLGGTP